MAPSGEIKDYYSILGVSRNATTEEIKRAFRDMAKKYHPDVCKEPDAHQKFIKIAEAYEILKDPESRRQYDEYLYSEYSRHERGQESGQDSSYSEFRRTQRQAEYQAERYSKMSLEDLITGVLGFVYELGRDLIFGEEDKPKLTIGDYILYGFCGFLLTIFGLLALTGIGTIPALAFFRLIYGCMKKGGKSIGIGPLLISTIVADSIVVILILTLIYQIYH